MPKSSNLFELYKSAHLAALDAANSASTKSEVLLALEKGPSAEFTNDGQDVRDWEGWKIIFTQRFVDMRNKAGMPTQSAFADSKVKPDAKPVSSPAQSPA